MKFDMNKLKGTIFEVMDVVAYDSATDRLAFASTDNETVTLSITSDTSELIGKDGAVLYSRPLAKKGSLKGTSSFIDFSLLQTQFGSEFEKITNYAGVRKMEIIKPDGTGKFFTTYKAHGAEGNELKNIYIGSVGYTQDDVAATETFSYDASTKEITLPTGLTTPPAQIEVHYDVLLAEADVMEVTTTSKAKSYNMYCNTSVVIPCNDTGNEERRFAQFIFRATPSSNVDFTTGADYTKEDWEFTLISGCSSSGLFTLAVYDDEAIDK